MRRAKDLPVILLTLFLLVGPWALAKDPASPVSDGITVGEFSLRVVRLAEVDPAVRKSLTADEAVARLKRAGLRFRGSPGALLTNGERSAFFLAVANGLLDRIVPPPPGFETCADRVSVPECLTCCAALPGGSNDLCGGACGRVHADQQPPVSPSDPTTP